MEKKEEQKEQKIRKTQKNKKERQKKKERAKKANKSEYQIQKRKREIERLTERPASDAVRGRGLHR